MGLGALLYRLLVGQPPFDAPALAELVLQVASAEPIPPTAPVSDIPPALEAAILHCLQKDPARRPQTVADLARALVPFAPAGGYERASAPRGSSGQGRKRLPPTTGSGPAPRAVPASGPPSAPSGTMASLLPTTRGLTRTPAQPGSRRVLGVALGAVAIAVLALALWGAVALPGRAPEATALQAAAAASRDEPVSGRARQDTGARGADPLIAPEPPAVRDALPPQQPFGLPVVAPATDAAPSGSALQGRRAPPATSASATPKAPSAPGGTNPLELPDPTRQEPPASDRRHLAFQPDAGEAPVRSRRPATGLAPAVAIVAGTTAGGAAAQPTPTRAGGGSCADRPRAAPAPPRSARTAPRGARPLLPPSPSG